MIEIDIEWLRKHGVPLRGNDDPDDLVGRVNNRIRQFIPIWIPGELSERQLIKYDELHDRNPAVGKEEIWILKNVPDGEVFIKRVQDHIGQLIRAATDKHALLISWSHPEKESPRDKLVVNTAWLKSLGVPINDRQDGLSLARKAYAALEMRVGNQLAQEMSDEQLEAFDKKKEAGDEAGMYEIMSTARPYFKDVVKTQFELLAKEIHEATDKRAFIEKL